LLVIEISHNFVGWEELLGGREGRPGPIIGGGFSFHLQTKKKKAKR